MVRQCAWCLRLIDGAGEHISLLPVPKCYEATHGMCINCGTKWMQQVEEDQAIQDGVSWSNVPSLFLVQAQKQQYESRLAECS